MYVRKITRHGHSNVVALPPAYMKPAGIKNGDHVRIALTPEMRIVIMPLEAQHEQARLPLPGTNYKDT